MGNIKGLTVFLFAAGASVSAQAADDVANHCAEFAENNGVSDEPCSCIVDSIGDDADLVAAYIAVEGFADYETAPTALKDAISDCIPE